MTSTVETIRRIVSVRLKVPAGFFRQPRKSAPNLWHFGLAVSDVMAMRIWRAMTGELSATEARRMVMEKQLAAVQAHLACATSILAGKAALAPRAYFAVYHHTVQSNRSRLRSRRSVQFFLASSRIKAGSNIVRRLIRAKC